MIKNISQTSNNCQHYFSIFFIYSSFHFIFLVTITKFIFSVFSLDIFLRFVYSNRDYIYFITQSNLRVFKSWLFICKKISAHSFAQRRTKEKEYISHESAIIRKAIRKLISLLIGILLEHLRGPGKIQRLERFQHSYFPRGDYPGYVHFFPEAIPIPS